MIDIGNNTVYLGGALPDEKGTSNGGLELLDTLENFNLNFISGSITPETWATVYGPSPLLLSKAKANGLGYVKLFGGTEQRNLPSEYTQVEYLESSGTQYIDTEYKPNGNTSIDIKFETSAGSHFVFGSRKDTTGNDQQRFCLYVANGNSHFNPQYGNNNYSGVGTFALSTVYQVQMNKNGFVVDGITEQIFTPQDFTGENNLILFGNNTNGTIVSARNKIYYFEIYENDTLVGNFVPAKRKSDNVLGMYDTVSGTFFTNAGTGTFTAGADVAPTPDTPMNIVSNNGVLKYGYQSVNMFDKDSTLEDGEIWAPTGVTQSLAGYYGTNQIHVIGGHTYTRNGSHGAANYIKFSDGTWTNQSDSSATITMPDNAVLWVFNNTTATSRDTMMVVEGASLPAEYVPYKGYGIYTDGTQETVEITGKNIASAFQLGTIGTNGIITAINTRATNTDLIRIKPSGTYTFSVNGPNYIVYECCTFDKNKNYIKFLPIINDTTKTITFGADVYYIRYSVRKRDNSTVSLSEFTTQLELGSTATSYTPYFNGGTATAEMLLKVGDYQDVQSILDGAVTRNVGVKVLDGTEDWSISDDDCFSSSISDKLSSIGIVPISTHFKSAPNTGTISVPDNGIGASSNINNKQVWIKMTSIPSVNNFKVYLADQYNAGTPVIVVYPLATPTTESVSGQTLNTTSGDNVLEITQASIDSLQLEAKYKKTK